MRGGEVWFDTMKCEICNNKDAETAISVKRDGEEQELYVCKDCARQERLRRQKKSQRTHKSLGGAHGVSVSVTQVGGDGASPPQFLEALMNAVNGMVSDMERAEKEKRARKEPKFSTFPSSRVDAEYRIGERLHLEGLHLIGEMPAVQRAVDALEMRLVGVDADGVKETGHVYTLEFACSPARAKRVVKDIVDQERNARVRLMTEMPRVFGDSLCRALAILKNCRLLSSGEFFDLLSPLRLAALEDMLDGITLDEIDACLAQTDLSSKDESLSLEDRDAADSERADEMNRRFEDVMLNERAEERFL